MDQKQFEPSPEQIESDIESISTEFEKHRSENPELSEKEVLKTAIRNYTAPHTAVSQKTEPHLHIPKYLSDAPEEVQERVEELISLAWEKGIPRAAKSASEAGPLYLDAFHDALAGKLEEKIKKKKTDSA